MSDPRPDATARRASRATLEIRGPAGTAVSVFALGQAPARPPRIFEGRLPASGRLRLRAPRNTLRVLAAAYEATVDFPSGTSYHRVDVHP